MFGYGLYTYTPNIILIAAAVIPAAYLLYFIYKHDRMEKESPRLLLRLVILGVLSTLAAAATETVGDYILQILGLQQNGVLYRFLFYFFVVALSEEGFKYLLLYRRTWKEPEFNCQFDGLVYAVFVSLGFALWENIRYVLSYGMSTALVRAITAVPGHACFGVFMGLFYGMAKRQYNAGRLTEAKKSKKLALLVPVLLHGTYDFFATTAQSLGYGIFIAFVVAMFIFSFRLVKKLSAADQKI